MWGDLYEKMKQLADTLAEDINLSRKCDSLLYKIGYHTVADDIKTAENWFSERMIWLDNSISSIVSE